MNKHRVGEIFYNEASSKFYVITDIYEHTHLQFTYYIEYIPEPERRFNPLRSFSAGGWYSNYVFDSVFKSVGNV